VPPATGDAEADRVCVSPQGDRIAFVRAGEAGYGIYTSDLAGSPSSVQRVVEDLVLEVEDLAWSPRGSNLGYVLGAPLGGSPQVGWVSAVQGEWSGRVPGASFAWMPGGDAIVIADPARKSLWIYSVPPGKTRELGSIDDDMDPAFPPRIAISPNGSRIAVTAGRAGEGVSEVWVITRDGATIVKSLLTEIPGAGVHILPFWSPTSATLALYVVHYEQHKTAIIAVPRLEGDGVVLYESSLIDPPLSPAWSPSGKTIVLSRVERAPDETGSSPSRLVLLDAHRETFVPLTEPGEVSGRPHFVDERTIAVDGGAMAHVLGLADAL
jgi:Tol biopolymer transport system component